MPLPDEPDLTAELDAAEEIVMGRADKVESEHVAVSRMTLFGGKSYEVITVSRAFLIAALEDARSWCHGGRGGPRGTWPTTTRR